MVKNPDVKKVILAIFLRVVALCITVYIASISNLVFLDILEKHLGYESPAGSFWGGDLTDNFVSLYLALIFFGSIIFGTLGKWWDFAFIILFISLGIWEYQGISTTTSSMFVGLAVAALLGNVIGFGLKLLRQKHFPKFDI